IAPSRLFTKPSVGSKIVCHVIAVTTVRVGHGTSQTGRNTPCPRKAECMAIAMARPRIVSKVTEAMVKMNVVFTASQNSELWSAVDEFLSPAQRDNPATRTLYSCRDSQIA